MKFKLVTLIIVALALAIAPLAFADDGATLYKAKCSSCHGADGKGQTVMGKKMGLRDLGSADVQKQSDADLHKITADGKGKMPAYKDKLSDGDVNALVAFMRTFAAK